MIGIEVSCPACGSLQVTTTSESGFLTMPFANKAMFTTILHTCEICRESGDFTGENDFKIAEAGQKAHKEAIENILEFLAKQGKNQAYIERVLGLPQHTIDRWKGGECLAVGSALLRVIGTYPWILEVADHRRDYWIDWLSCKEE
jgi:hypothetical protein